MGAALAMAKDTTSVGSGGRADKATVAAPEALESGACGRAGGAGAKRPLHGKAWDGVNTPLGKGERVLIGSERMQPCKGNRQDGACRQRERV